jgi:hypothetical protein
MSIRGELYVVSRARWDQALSHLDPAYVTARFEVSPGWCLARPHWLSVKRRDQWLKAVQPLEVSEEELDESTRVRLGSFELMF